MKNRDRYAAIDSDPDDRGLSWADRAYCKKLIDAGRVDPELWFPASEGKDTPEVQRATAICQACKVWPECRAWALEHGEEFGIWGGLTARQRRQILTRQAVA